MGPGRMGPDGDVAARSTGERGTRFVDGAGPPSGSVDGSVTFGFAQRRQSKDGPVTPPSNRRRRSGILLAVMGGIFLVAIPWIKTPADVQRLLGRTTEVSATVTKVATVDAKTSGFPRYIRQRYTVTWPDPSGGARTGTSTVITRHGAGHDLGHTIPAQWIPGTDDVTVATTWQSVILVGWPLAGGLLLLVVGIGMTRGVRWLRRRRNAG